MCGRYQFTLEQCEEIRRIAQAIDRKYGNGAWTPGEIRPTALAPVLIASDGGVHPELQTWGCKMPYMVKGLISQLVTQVTNRPLGFFPTLRML